MAVCAVCRHLRERPTAGDEAAAPLAPMLAPPGAWCPIWQMWIADPANTGCTLFEAIEVTEEPSGSDATGATRTPTAGDGS